MLHVRVVAVEVLDPSVLAERALSTSGPSSSIITRDSRSRWDTLRDMGDCCCGVRNVFRVGPTKWGVTGGVSVMGVDSGSACRSIRVAENGIGGCRRCCFRPCVGVHTSISHKGDFSERLGVSSGVRPLPYYCYRCPPPPLLLLQHCHFLHGP